MYVCLCAGISDKRIRELVNSGCKNLRSIQQQSRAGANCGACVCDLKKMLRDVEQTDRSPSSEMHRELTVD